MLFYAPPDFTSLEGDDARQSVSSRSYLSNRRDLASKHGRGSPRSLSPPTDEDISTIAAEAMKWADVRSVVSSRTKTVNGNGNAKGKDAVVQGEQGSGGQPIAWGECGGGTDIIPPLEIPKVSVLTEMLEGQGQSKRVMNLKVYTPFGREEGRKLEPIHVKVPESANATDVIKATLRILKETQEVNQNPDVYKLRVAEDDSGNPDEDLPVLDKKTGLRRMGFDALVLCFATPGMRKPREKTLEDLMFTVVCGIDKKRFRRVNLPPDVVFKDAVGLICEKFKKDPNRHVLRLLADGTEKDVFSENHVPYTDRSLGALHREYGIRELYLRSKGKEAEDPESDEDLEPPSGAKTKIFRDWDEASASRYTEYQVVKINKFGLRQNRVLGIDREKIYNMMCGNKVQKTKNPERSIGDIVYIRTFLDKPCYIEIEYKNSKSGKDQIECQSPIEAHEVATKVSFLLELHRSSSQQPPAIEKKLPITSGMDKLLAKITPVLHSPRGETRT
eukprot:TRINITY_DN3205_c0_g3_i1.p1 TRINITY_DN3205_c0_g3~~TRINITY_DN3205_c0_g3_i1.p1  ORF type:complete len:518 (+),score=48.84 TRINITY_DN3205_c0_g3_i1:50-1555(+)